MLQSASSSPFKPSFSRSGQTTVHSKSTLARAAGISEWLPLLIASTQSDSRRNQCCKTRSLSFVSDDASFPERGLFVAPSCWLPLRTRVGLSWLRWFPRFRSRPFSCFEKLAIFSKLINSNCSCPCLSQALFFSKTRKIQLNFGINLKINTNETLWQIKCVLIRSGPSFVQG